ncbi:FtsK/SpoIIIE domain-containing protein [Lysinibacillus sphaericus]|uniref:FtsK/SpoIIIE domain-containing protein n=1 Tax=Lysinibacillus sphaericus TaxID=1421 RepID=UPI0006912BA1|nr:FtsK/SpoIIIE domain-containing protein [Lysinibacillus sphaericus]QPA58348.1 cell division protein FtsK [Lysinibacillus sphaericus]
MHNLFNSFRDVFRKKRSDWKAVKYPTNTNKKDRLVGYLLIFVGLFLGLFLTGILIDMLPSLGIHLVGGYISLNWVWDILFVVLWVWAIYKALTFYFNKKYKSSETKIANSLAYMIHSLKLFDETVVEVEKDGKEVRERVIERVIQILYRQDGDRVYVRVMRGGDRFTQVSISLGENLESALGLELDKFIKNVNYAEYSFLKRKDERINLASTNIMSSESDVIKVSGNISYELHNVPHALIVGGTGSGKSWFILGKIISYLKLTPQADLYIIDPKKADLSLLRFVTGFENKVATEPNQICRILREVVELMENRYREYFSDVSAFGKTYRDFDNLPVVIVIFDEFSAFMHSVDKKIAKEALDYVFQIVMKGRQAGVTIEILMQRPSADDLPTNIRAQMGFKAGLGAMDSIGYNMIFDTNDIEYKTVVEKGGGYIQIDGVHTAPVYFETPYIEKDFDFIAEIEKLMQR